MKNLFLISIAVLMFLSCNAQGNKETTNSTKKDFGYKDLVPLFTAPKFNADEWAELFVESGARFAGPAGEHADGFSMWDSKVNP